MENKRRLELEELADTARQQLTVYDQFPVPMETVFARLHDLRISPKIDTAVVPDDEMKLDQAYTIADNQQRKIVLSQSTSDELRSSSRAKFTLAHEIGHALLHSSQRAMSRSISGKTYRQGVSVEEQEANYFARAFLIPRSKVSSQMTAQEVASIFGVAIKTAEIRLGDLFGKKREIPDEILAAISELRKKFPKA